MNNWYVCCCFQYEEAFLLIFDFGQYLLNITRNYYAYIYEVIYNHLTPCRSLDTLLALIT